MKCGVCKREYPWHIKGRGRFKGNGAEVELCHECTKIVEEFIGREHEV